MATFLPFVVCQAVWADPFAVLGQWDPSRDLFLHYTNATLVYDQEPLDGNPWYRYKATSSRGTASHEDFDGMVAVGRFQDDILLAHNVVRRQFGLSPVSWSEELQELALRRLTKLAPDCYIQHRPISQLLTRAGYPYIGENLYKVVGFEPTGVDVADAWYAEKEDYRYGKVGNSCTKACAGRTQPPCTVGHFTQMLWESTTHIGCMVMKCPSREKTHLSVCYYGPGGNLTGSVPFSAAVARRMGQISGPC